MEDITLKLGAQELLETLKPLSRGALDLLQKDETCLPDRAGFAALEGASTNEITTRHLFREHVKEDE